MQDVEEGSQQGAQHRRDPLLEVQQEAVQTVQEDTPQQVQEEALQYVETMDDSGTNSMDPHQPGSESSQSSGVHLPDPLQTAYDQCIEETITTTVDTATDVISQVDTATENVVGQIDNATENVVGQVDTATDVIDPISSSNQIVRNKIGNSLGLQMAGSTIIVRNIEKA